MRRNAVASLDVLADQADVPKYRAMAGPDDMGPPFSTALPIWAKALQPTQAPKCHRKAAQRLFTTFEAPRAAGYDRATGCTCAGGHCPSSPSDASGLHHPQNKNSFPVAHTKKLPGRYPARQPIYPSGENTPSPDMANRNQPTAPWQCLYFLPEPQGQSALRLTFISA